MLKLWQRYDFYRLWTIKVIYKYRLWTIKSQHHSFRNVLLARKTDTYPEAPRRCVVRGFAHFHAMENIIRWITFTCLGRACNSHMRLNHEICRSPTDQREVISRIATRGTIFVKFVRLVVNKSHMVCGYLNHESNESHECVLRCYYLYNP